MAGNCGDITGITHGNLIMIEVGKQAPAFSLPTDAGGTLAVPTGKPMILFFYPKDDTPGCTTEAKGFTETKPAFADLGVEIVGLSPDTVQKHDKFIAKHDLGVTLASDEEKSTLQAYGVWVEKSMYGRTYMGVERSTFLIDGKGKVLEVWRKVKVKGHVDAVFQAARQHFG